MRHQRLAALLLALLSLLALPAAASSARRAGAARLQASARAPRDELQPLRLVRRGRRRPATPRARTAARGPTVSAALTALLHSGAITEAVYAKDYAAYTAAKKSLARLSGTRRAELGAVLANVQAIAAARLLSASRQAAVFLTLERNRRWWTTEALLSSGERVSFPNSKLIWEYYPGQGIEIQWLATFGKGNGYYLSGHENTNLRQLVEEVIPLATHRAGGIAWEYLFRFDGGAPPWTSGLSQGTALQVLSRAWSRFKEPAFLAAAQQALGVFQAAPPQGVRVATKAGAMYAEYTYAPSDRILNGFIQAVVGLYDYTTMTRDPVGLKLFEAGDAEARAEVPRYDTGAWSLYDQFGESSLNYHELLTEFLQHLCERTRKGLPPTGASPPPPAPAGRGTTTPGGGTPTTPAPGGTGTGGGTSPGRAAAAGAGTAHGAARTAHGAAAPATTQIPGDAIYCTTAQRFTDDLTTPPKVSLLSTRLRGATQAGVTVSLSKMSTLSMTIRQGSRVVWSNRATVAAGKPKLLWPTPARGGTFAVSLTASDLAGNFATATGTILVTRH